MPASISTCQRSALALAVAIWRSIVAAPTASTSATTVNSCWAAAAYADRQAGICRICCAYSSISRSWVANSRW